MGYCAIQYGDIKGDIMAEINLNQKIVGLRNLTEEELEAEGWDRTTTAIERQRTRNILWKIAEWRNDLYIRRVVSK